jgi:putative ABC transport system permease protein
MRGWRPALRIAWRDVLRAKGRSALVLVMICLPVLAVSAAAVVWKTSEVSGAESATRLMGAADARLWSEGRGPLVQAPDPGDYDWAEVGDVDRDRPVSDGEVREVLGDGARLLPLRRTQAQARLGERAIYFEVTEVDLHDPLAEGLFELREGTLPAGPHEVVVNEAMTAKGFALGDEIRVVDTTATIVGVGRDATNRENATVLGPIGAVGVSDTNRSDWLVESGPVSWAQVRELNAIGVVVASRAVLADPPDVESIAEQLGYDTGRDEMLAVVALIVTMTLLEVVLLAGPAFAVGARRQARVLALMAASGGTPSQTRRVVLAGGLVLGLLAAVAGVLLGILVGWAALPVVQLFDWKWFGPFEVPWGWLLVVGAFGLLSAFLAAVVPAVIASRQDVVAVLAGRRGDRAPRATTPILGLLMLGLGIAGSAYGAVNTDDGEGAMWISFSAIVSVLGMVLVVPFVVTLLGRAAHRLPLASRYAARDAVRHRTRTVPAVAAVAATVAGVVALGIANASDEEGNAATYQPQMAMGDGRVSWWPTVLPGEETPDTDPVWARLEQVVRETAPDVGVTPVQGLPESIPGGGWVGWTMRVPDTAAGEDELYLSWGGGYGASMIVAEDARTAGLDDTARAQADAALAEGRMVVFNDAPVATDEVVVLADRWDDEMAEEATLTARRTVPAAYVVVDGPAPSQAIVPPELADGLAEAVGGSPRTYALVLTGGVDRETETAIKEAVGGAQSETSVYVERGYQRPVEATIVLLVLGVLGGVLMVGGTLTATFLALADARPDLATLSAVGAAPRARRAVAASYALVIGVAGAVLGAVVGFVPGIAVSRPLTSWSSGPDGSVGPYLDIPWLLIAALVVALPLLTAAVVGLTARSRLPMVARLD